MTWDNEAHGFDIDNTSIQFTFGRVTLETRDNAANGVDVNMGHGGFDLNNVRISTNDDADGIVLLDGTNFSLDDSTFTGLRHANLLDSTNVTGLKRCRKLRISFGEMLLNDGGSNGPIGGIAFSFVY